MSALECWRKGHNVVGVLERNEGPVYTGEDLAMFHFSHQLTPIQATSLSSNPPLCPSFATGPAS